MLKKTQHKPHVYRILTVDPIHVHWALNRLSTAPNSSQEASYNAIVMPEYSELLTNLKSMTPQQLEQLSRVCPDVVSYIVDLRLLSQRMHHIQTVESIRKAQLQTAQWLIEHKASNQMVFDLCTSVTIEDLKRIRRELNIPASRGRLLMPDFTTRLAIVKTWHSITERNLYERYKALWAQFPTFNLGQLYTIVSDDSIGEES